MTTRMRAVSRIDAARVAGQLIAIGEGVTARTQALVLHHGTLLYMRVKAAAPRGDGDGGDGRDYAGSIVMVPQRRGLNTTVEVGTPEEYGERLEFGFHGQDALGRRYNQQPQPHWYPAARQTGKELISDLVGLVRGATQ